MKGLLREKKIKITFNLNRFNSRWLIGDKHQNSTSLHRSEDTTLSPCLLWLWCLFSAVHATFHWHAYCYTPRSVLLLLHSPPLHSKEGSTIATIPTATLRRRVLLLLHSLPLHSKEGFYSCYTSHRYTPKRVLLSPHGYTQSGNCSPTHRNRCQMVQHTAASSDLLITDFATYT